MDNVDMRQLMETYTGWSSCHEHPHQKYIERLEKQHAENLGFWAFLLLQGYHLVFYGYGAKHGILSQLASHPAILEHHTVCILDKLVSKTICSNHSILPYLFVAYTVDVQSQSTLVRILKEHPQSRMICSVDHVNSGLLDIWNGPNWLFWHIPTFKPYSIDIQKTNIGKDLSRDVERIQTVLNNLNAHTRKMYLILAKIQMKQEPRLGIEMEEYYQLARKELLTRTETMFRSQLRELFEHKILVTRKTEAGQELVYIPVEKTVLEEIVL